MPVTGRRAKLSFCALPRAMNRTPFQGFNNAAAAVIAAKAGI
ncbi:MAG: hypothetical protein ACR2P4_06160 [Gammaproteobacteria bacterium]